MTSVDDLYRPRSLAAYAPFIGLFALLMSLIRIDLSPGTSSEIGPQERYELAAQGVSAFIFLLFVRKYRFTDHFTLRSPLTWMVGFGALMSISAAWSELPKHALLKGMQFSRWPKGVQPPRTYEYTLEMGWKGEEGLRQGGVQGLIQSGSIMVGDPESCGKIVQRYVDVGVDQLIIHMQAGAPSNERVKESIRTFGKHVIPRFNKAAARA
jgi:hypothetical protein